MSQVSLAESSPGPGDRDLVSMVKCVSSENISRAGNTRVKPDLILDVIYPFLSPGFLPPGLSPQRSVFPGVYMRSRLSVLPEEQGTLTNQRPVFRSRDLSQPIRDSGPQSTPFQQPSSTLRRKRSQSLADLQMSINGISDQQDIVI